MPQLANKKTSANIKMRGTAVEINKLCLFVVHIPFVKEMDSVSVPTDAE
jgi:hypothetical protein